VIGYLIGKSSNDPCVMPLLLENHSSFPGKMLNDIFVYFDAKGMEFKLLLNESHRKITMQAFDNVKANLNRCTGFDLGDPAYDKYTHASQYSIVCHLDAFNQNSQHHVRMIPPVSLNLFKQLAIGGYSSVMRKYLKVYDGSQFVASNSTTNEIAGKLLYMVRTLAMFEANYMLAMRRDPAGVDKHMERYTIRIEVSTSLFPLSVYAAAVKGQRHITNFLFWIRVFFIYNALYFRRGAPRLFLRRVLSDVGFDVMSDRRDWITLLSDESLWVATMNNSYLLLESDPFALRSAYCTLLNKSDFMLVHDVPYEDSGVTDPRVKFVSESDFNGYFNKHASHLVLPRHCVVNFSELVPSIVSSASEHGLTTFSDHYEGACVYNEACLSNDQTIDSLI